MAARGLPGMLAVTPRGRWPLSSRRGTVLALAAASLLVYGLGGAARISFARTGVPAMVAVPPGSFGYRMAGDFSREERPADAPLVAARLERGVEVMRHQVTVAEYEKCVAGGACAALAASVSGGADLPAVGVSWEDATAYAAWLSSGTGQSFRLPSDEEWAYAAGGRFKGDPVPVGDPKNPAQRWLAAYDRETAGRERTDSRVRPIGSFGANEHGLQDLSGNVWEWTATCFERRLVDAAGAPGAVQTSNCGVRIVEGADRTFLPDFIRDARGGGCSFGVPPSNLGFRLVRAPALPTAR